jgi:putative transcriptional regulator
MRVKEPAKIRRWRKQRRFSQRDLAYLVRRSQTTIYLIEAGKLRDISEDLALAIAGRLDLPWEDLFEVREVFADSAMTTDVHLTDRKTA